MIQLAISAAMLAAVVLTTVYTREPLTPMWWLLIVFVSAMFLDDIRKLVRGRR